ncbi:L-threonylcarbamoyladenylate synthase [Gallalistipes aquisgranensis]|uniref:L-threonylcarbamoyladenylate synthase n=1 Tax=Gallalistipes aquisgranensis TaxID=2779358 RepID=UPI001CF7FE35|nr:L-threonylcarbamoyladenylate synthase [Gallalistipes aquisgranensis]MBE5033600.1 threonylcarbamoyl-AMP synthase [Gallalistipes aquisgranensis]
MIVKIYPENPNEKQVARVAEVLARGGVVIYPTDSVYAFGCSIRSPRALERIKQIRGKKETELAMVCDDLSHIADYARVDNAAFKLLKRNLPAPFTFVLKASSKVPDKVLERRKNIGVRIPANPIARALVAELGCPMLTASVKDDDRVVEYTTDPELIHERYGALVDLVVDGGYGDNRPTTLVDLTGDEPEILREGKGELKW